MLNYYLHSAINVDGLQLLQERLVWILDARSDNRFTPGIQFLIHANIKASFEYQFRPQQSVTIITNPITGLPSSIEPFRTNTAVVALEWVY